MKKVYQTDVSDTSGNCWQAAVASIFELPIEEVPHFVMEHDPYSVYEGWLKALGYMVIYRTTNSPDEIEREWRHSDVEPYCLLTVKSLKYPGTAHCVVGDFNDVGLSLSHDPNQENVGKTLDDYEIEMVDFYVKI